MKRLTYLLILIGFLSCEKNQSPDCTIINPENNAVVTIGESFLVSVDASDPDGTITEVKLFFDNIEIVSSENSPYNFELTIDAYTPGTYPLKATAVDAEGLEASDEIQITIDATVPSVITSEISEIAALSANGGGDITFDGGSEITAKGVCWSTSPDPIISDNHSVDGAGSGRFTSSLTGLTCGTTYYVRAYATNSVGTAYGNQVSFTTSVCTK